MNTVIIGIGNVAYHLAKALSQNGMKPTAVFGRNREELKRISNELDIPAATAVPEADLYIIAVSDSAIQEVSMLISKKDCLVAHTSGSLPKEILSGDYRKAVFYPLQTFTKSKALNYKEIPFFIEAENDADESLLKALAGKISEKVMSSTYESRKYIHLTAVFACNFANHLFARAKEISDSQSIPFDYFIPLIDETVAKIHSINPKDAQTGPAVRNDKRVMEIHKSLINDPVKMEIYNTLNASIAEMYQLK